MVDTEVVFRELKVLARAVEAVISNYKKDSASRKLDVGYYEERLRRLETAWEEFERKDTEVRSLPEITPEHDYFKGETYETTKINYDTFQKHFLERMNALKGTALPMSQPPSSTRDSNDKPSAALVSVEKNAVFTGKLRRYQASANSLRRTMARPEPPENTKAWFKARAEAVQRGWQQLDELHQQVYESCEDPEAQGFNLEEHIRLEEDVQDCIVRLQMKVNATTETPPSPVAPAATPGLTLPKIALPTFNGDYLHWRQFRDLFMQMVHNQPMSACQKLWYLKVNLSGEAGSLIRNFALSDENYQTAWKTLNERFDNRRLLVSALIDKLMGQPSQASEKPSVVSIKSLHDTTQECLRGLENLQISTRDWDPLLLHVLLRKLDSTTHALYHQSLANPRELPPLKGLLDFLQVRFQALEALSGTTKDPDRNHKKVTKATVATVAALRCPRCSQDHPLYYCPEFLQDSAVKRLNFVRLKKLCVNCLREVHQSSGCAARSCKECTRKHNTLLHMTGSKISKQTKTTTPGSTVKKPDIQPTLVPPALTLTTLMQPGARKNVLLSTAVVKVVASNGRVTDCRAVLDPGSQINLVTERIIKKLGLAASPQFALIEGVGGSIEKAHRKVDLGLKSRVSGYAAQLEAYVLDKIISPQPSQSLDTSEWQIPGNIKLVDPEFHRTERIDMLLSAEHFYEVLAIGQIKLGPELPVLQNTLLGWIVAGRVVTPQRLPVTCGVLTEETQLTQAIKRFWEVEEVSDPQHNLTATERACEVHFAQTTQRESDGRFLVRLPFKEDPKGLGDSQDIAIRRFMAIERRMEKNPDLRRQYCEFMDEYERLGHMEQIKWSASKKAHCFLPHHCVLKPGSSTTKLRVVFDASSRTSTNVSLNNILHTGPTIQDDLFAILTRFRLPRFVFTADIVKMYRQIRLQHDDCNFQLVIWRTSPTQPLRYYRLKTITYGTTCAPYLATKCLQVLAQAEQDRAPLGSSALQHDCYIDDVMTGADSLTEAIQTQEELRQILTSAGMHLHKWCANHPHLLQQISVEDREVQLDFSSLSEDYIKTLGVIWFPKTDDFQIGINLDLAEVKFTKRTIASDIARMFDPLGILAPVIVTAKLFLQALWRLELDWDAALPLEIHTQWAKFRSELPSLRRVRFPRHVIACEKPIQLQLHTFCDASEKAYGAVIYVRSTSPSGQVNVRLLCSKSRVAPIKVLTVPRLELCAAKLGAELTSRVKRALSLPDVFHVLWSDSEVALAWINSTASSYSTFVANRVSTIQSLSRPTQWRHVASHDNSADILSRGLAPAELRDCKLWSQGPSFLTGPEADWPPPYKGTKACEVERKQIRIAITTTASASNHFVYEVQHGNSFGRLQRVIVYMLRFVARCRTSSQSSQVRSRAVTSHELSTATGVIVKCIQQHDFREDLRDIQLQGQVSKNSPLSSLTPFLDSDGILRVGGRLEASQLAFEAKHPMLLPFANLLTRLLMTDIHHNNCHLGAQALLATTRQRFWPIRGKQLARAVVQKCVRCVKARPQLFNQIMGNLPGARVQAARPFIRSGVDFCGPMLIHYRGRGVRPQKGYIAIFCCFATKAVHLELVSDLSTEAFIGALKRFIGRRGLCKDIYCDNATNFVGAQRQLRELSSSLHSAEGQHKVTDSCSTRGIQFHFIPPRAPHFGGLWEAAVKSAKNLLRRGASSATLTYEELHTLVVQVEAILNSRPLTAMSDDPNDLAALTPGHFLIGEPLTAMVDARAEPVAGELHTRWKRIIHLKNEFWRRWSREYLNQLQHRVKWQQGQPNATRGTIVIIKDDNLPTMKWPLGRIIDTHQGADGFVRVADVKTATGIVRRPIHRLAPLPVTENTIPEAAGPEANTQTQPEAPHQADIPDTYHTGLRSGSKRTSLLSLLLVCLLSPLTVTNPIKVSSTGPHPGLHFQSLGNAFLSTSEWKLLVYYDLEAYWTELATLQNGTIWLQQLCDRDSRQTDCSHLHEQFRHLTDQFSNANQMLRIRSRRGAINVVGGLARSLFGVLDEEYANQMAQTIKTMQGDQTKLHSLLKNQTSIIDSTLNLLGQTEQMAQKRFASIEHELTKLSNEVKGPQLEGTAARVPELISILSFQMTLATLNLQRIQSSLLDVITDTQHGNFNPLLLSQQQLNAAMTDIRDHLPENQRLPVGREDFLKLFGLTSIKAKANANFILFELRMPLIEVSTFELYRILPIPTAKHNHLVAIQPTAPYLIISPHRDVYYPLNEIDYAACNWMEPNTHLCRQSHPLYHKDANMSTCEVTLLRGMPTMTNCHLVELLTSFSWTNIPQSNEWIYAFTTPVVAQLVCGGNTFILTLQESGILQLTPDCTLKSDAVTIKGHRIYESSIKTTQPKTYYATDHDNLGHVQQHLEPTPFRTHTSEINDLRNQLKEQDLSWSDQLDAHDVHQYALGYLSFVAVIAIVAFLWCKAKNVSCQPRSQRPRPVPLPRRHSLPHTLEEVEQTVQRGGGC